MSPPGTSSASALARELEPLGVGGARAAIVLGSGLGALVEALADARDLPTHALEHWPRSSVPGHAGRLVTGELAGVPVVVQAGRIHLYEGRTAREVTRVVRALAEVGVRELWLTCAAGAIEPSWSPGDLMRFEDHLCLQGRPPLARGEAGWARVYDAELGARLDRAAAGLGVALHRGVYAGLLGPSYETPAEIAMLRGLGAHAVGMSTVAEAVAARSAGMRVAAVACLTNHAAGVAAEVLRHEDVLAAGSAAGARLVSLLEAAVRAG